MRKLPTILNAAVFLFAPIILPGLFLLLAGAPAYGGACVNGPQSGVWGPGRYISLGGITVNEGDTLIIQPGAVILISRPFTGLGGAFTVNGTLIARGTPDNPIIISGLDRESYVSTPGGCSGQEKRVPGAWIGMRFFTPGPGSILEHCHILYAGDADGTPSISVAGDFTEDNNLTISGCLIAYGNGEGIHLNNGASPLIENTTIKDHARHGLVEGSPLCHPVVNGCTITGNGLYPIQAYAGNIHHFSGVFVHGNNPDAIWVSTETVTTSGVWQDHGVPYYYDHGDPFSIIVPEEITLTLEAGVEIRMGHSRGLIIDGTLVAAGDSCRTITFAPLDTAATPGSWSYLDLQGSGPGTILDYVDLSYGKSLRLSHVEDHVVVSNCRVTHCSERGGLDITGNSSPLILNNLISDNEQSGVWVSVTAGYAPVFRHNRIENNQEGILLYSNSTTADLGTSGDPGHNALISNENYELVHYGADTVYAIGNYWVDTDSTIIDNLHIYDRDEDAGSGPVLFMPFDSSDQSRPPGDYECPPACAALSVTITTPTEEPVWTTSSHYLTLGGAAADDRGVAGISWTNAATGESWQATLGSPRTAFHWTATQILLAPGNNLITVTAGDLDGCVATDQLTVNYTESATGCWLTDLFDDLNTGSLDGQNGWLTVPGRASAQVISNAFGTGKVLELDPLTDEPVIMEKPVLVSTGDLHDLELLVLSDPGDTSMAKIEVKTTGNPDWDKKFQLYFGATMRLNFGPTPPEAIDFLSYTEPQRWYHVRAAMDLSNDEVDIYLDGVLVLEDITVGPGPIEEISISGWNFPGMVLFDDIRGCESTPVSVDQKVGLNKKFVLRGNAPNPFVSSTDILFELETAARVDLRVYDLFGRLVKTLSDERLGAGAYTINWDGSAQNGTLLPPGIYICRLQVDQVVASKRMILVRF